MLVELLLKSEYKTNLLYKSLNLSTKGLTEIESCKRLLIVKKQSKKSSNLIES